MNHPFSSVKAFPEEKPTSTWNTKPLKKKDTGFQKVVVNTTPYKPAIKKKKSALKKKNLTQKKKKPTQKKKLLLLKL